MTLHSYSATRNFRSLTGLSAALVRSEEAIISYAILRDFELIDLGSFPGIRPHVGGSVVGELYEVDDEGS